MDSLEEAPQYKEVRDIMKSSTFINALQRFKVRNICTTPKCSRANRVVSIYCRRHGFGQHSVRSAGMVQISSGHRKMDGKKET